MFCDNLSYIFMFLSIATSNMVATSLAKKVLRPFAQCDMNLFNLLAKVCVIYVPIQVCKYRTMDMLVVSFVC